MSMTDPISDMLTRIRNAQIVGKAAVDIPLSRVKKGIGQILMEEGYIEGVEVVETKDGWPQLRLGLKYHDDRPVIEEIRRISRPGRRHYVGKGNIPRVYQGLGMSILSTSRGLLSDRSARKQGVGGELLCTVF